MGLMFIPFRDIILRDALKKSPLATPPPREDFCPDILPISQKVAKKSGEIEFSEEKNGKIHLATKKSGKIFARCLREIEFSMEPYPSLTLGAKEFKVYEIVDTGPIRDRRNRG